MKNLKAQIKDIDIEIEEGKRIKQKGECEMCQLSKTGGDEEALQQGGIAELAEDLEWLTRSFFDYEHAGEHWLLSEDTLIAATSALFADRLEPEDFNSRARNDLGKLLFYVYSFRNGKRGCFINCRNRWDGTRGHEVSFEDGQEVHYITANYRQDADYLHDEILIAALAAGMDCVLESYHAGSTIEAITGW